MKISRTMITLTLVAMAAVATTNLQASGILQGIGNAVQDVGQAAGAVVEGTGRAVGDVVEGTGNAINNVTGGPVYRQQYLAQPVEADQQLDVEPTEEVTYEYED